MAPRSRDLRGAQLVIGGLVTQQTGAAVATLLFDQVGPSGIVFLRLVFAAVFLAAVARPTLRARRPSDWGVAAGYGLVLATLNNVFYHSIALIPLGAAMTLEILGPLVLSVAISRTRAGLAWAGLALSGVALLGRDGFENLDVAGVALALGAAAIWAGYILIAASTAARFDNVDGLAIAMVIAAIVSAPLGILDGGSRLLEPGLLGLGAGVALLSSVIPYSFELLALRGISASAFSVLLSLAPAVGAMAGWIILDQALTFVDGLAIVLVVAASMGAMSARTAPEPGTLGP